MIPNHITCETCQIWALRVEICNCHLGGRGHQGVSRGVDLPTLYNANWLIISLISLIITQKLKQILTLFSRIHNGSQIHSIILFPWCLAKVTSTLGHKMSIPGGGYICHLICQIWAPGRFAVLITEVFSLRARPMKAPKGGILYQISRLFPKWKVNLYLLFIDFLMPCITNCIFDTGKYAQLLKIIYLWDLFIRVLVEVAHIIISSVYMAFIVLKWKFSQRKTRKKWRIRPAFLC